MHLRIGRHVDVEPVAGRLADERDQLAGVAELARVGRARRQVAAQRDEVPDAVLAVAREHLGAGSSRVEPMHEMCGAAGDAFAADLEHRLERAFARRAAGAERHRAERRLSCAELAPRGAQLLHAFRRARREELEAVVRFGMSVRRADRVGLERRVDRVVDRRRHAVLAAEAHDRARQPRQLEPVTGDEVVRHRRLHRRR